MTCPSCGNVPPADVADCPACGTRLNVGPPDPPQLPSLRPIRGLSIAVVVLLATWIAVEVFAVAVDLWRVVLIDRAIADPVSVNISVLTINDLLYGAAGVLQTLSFIAAAVVAVVWLFRARDNAERANFTHHRRSRPWLILGWGVPVVSWWFPKQIIDDIWRASEPSTPLGGADLDSHPKPKLVYPWWACWLLYLWLSQVVMKLLYGRAGLQLEELETMKWSAIVEVGAAPIGIAAAVFAALVVRRISAFQEIRRSSSPHLALPGSAIA